MKALKKWLAVALCICVAVSFSACSMVSVNTDKDNAQVVAVVNGTEINKQAYKDLLPSMLYNYGMTESELESSEDAKTIKEGVLDTLVRQELLYQKAEEEGIIDNSEEHRQELLDELHANLESMKEYYRSVAEEELGLTPEEGEDATDAEESAEPSADASAEATAEASADASAEASAEPSADASSEASAEPSADASAEATAEASADASAETSEEPEGEASEEPVNEELEALVAEKYDAYVESAGYLDEEAYIDRQIRETAINDMYEQITGDIEYTEEEAQEYFDSQVAIQQPQIENDPSYYAFNQQFGGESYVNPSGSKYVKNLLISLPEDVQSEIAALRSNDENDEADALRDAELEKIKPAAEEALKRVKDDGEDFDAVMEEVGEDAGMQSEPAKTDGYLTYEGDNMVEEFRNAALALENEGDITDLVPTDFGYHIIKYVKDGEGPVGFESVKDSIMSSQLNAKKTQAFEEFIAEVKEGSNIKLYANRL